MIKTPARMISVRCAMLACTTNATDPQNAYPALWAPFVVVIEGAAQSAIANLHVDGSLM
jgi:hypothetical protein